MKKENIDNRQPKSRIAVLLFTIIATVTTITSIYCIYKLMAIDSFKKYIYLAIGLLSVIWIILVIRTKARFSKKKKKRFKNRGIIILQILYIIITLGFTLGFTYFYNYLGSFNKSEVEYSSSLVVMTSNKDIKKIKDLKNNTIGILKDKKSAEGYIIPRKVIKAKELEDYNEIKKYESYQELVADLYSGDVDAIFINTDYVSTYSSIETYQNISTETKIIYTKKKKMKKTEASKKTSLGKSITEPFTILLMGVDSTDEGLSKNTVALGDSIMLITFNPKTLNATLLSIPRDSYVPISCWSSKAENKITHSAAYGSDCMIKTIEDYFDINIDYYAKINFKGLVHLVDAVGGIDVEVPAHLCTDDSSRGKEVCIDEGMQHLDGEGALVLSRNRKQLAGGDLARGQNQQVVIKALINKIKNIRSATQFLKILETVSINIDTNFTQQQILSFYNIAEDIMSNNVAKNDVDLINITQLYLQGDGQMIYDDSSRLVLWDYIPNKDSKKDVINAMNVNLGKEKHDIIKEFSFSINEEYEKEIIGYGPYKTSYTYKLVPDFGGMSKKDAEYTAKKYGVNVTFTGGNGYVISQSAPANKRVDKLSGSVVLTLGGEIKTEENKETTKKKSCEKDGNKYYDKNGKEVDEAEYKKSCIKEEEEEKEEKKDSSEEQPQPSNQTGGDSTNTTNDSTTQTQPDE